MWSWITYGFHIWNGCTHFLTWIICDYHKGYTVKRLPIFHSSFSANFSFTANIRYHINWASFSIRFLCRAEITKCNMRESTLTATKHAYIFSLQHYVHNSASSFVHQQSLQHPTCSLSTEHCFMHTALSKTDAQFIISVCEAVHIYFQSPTYYCWKRSLSSFKCQLIIAKKKKNKIKIFLHSLQFQ